MSRLDNNTDKDLAIFKVVLPTLGHIDIMQKIVKKYSVLVSHRLWVWAKDNWAFGDF